MKPLEILRGSFTGRAVIFFSFAAFLSFLMVMYGLLQQQEYARTLHRVRTDALFSVKAAYQDYETTLLMHLADPAKVMVSDAQKRFSLMEERLAQAEKNTTDPEDKKTLSAIRAGMDKISPVTFNAPTLETGVQGSLREVLLAMTGIQSSLLGLDTALAEKGAALDQGLTMHHVAQLLMGVSAVALLLLIGRLLLAQSNVVHLLRLEKDTVDRKSMTQLAAIEAARDGMVILDAEGRILFMNRAFSLLHFLSGPGRKESIGKAWADLYDAQSARMVRETILPMARAKGYWHGESKLVNSRGKPFIADLSLTMLPEGGFIGTAQDTKDKHLQQKENEDLRLQYYQAQKMESLGRLAGGIAHDFNNILAAVTGYAEFLTQDLPKNSQTHGFAEKILLATSRAKTLIEQILNFSRSNDQVKVDLDLTTALTEAIALLRASIATGVSIDTHNAVPSAVIQANPTQISQALMNLCVNAQDAMDGKGSLRITLDTVSPGDLNIPAGLQVDQYPEGNTSAPVSFEDLGNGRTIMTVGSVVQGQKYARIAIADTGSGIGRSVMEHMFEPFFTTKDVHKGTGLGLASVHGILISHRGFLRVDTTLGRGSSFEMLFPLRGVIPRVAESIASDEDENDDSQAKGAVLVVDDQDDVRTTTCIALQRAGYEVFDSASPEEALDLVRGNPGLFALVVSDYAMPGMTGVELARAVYAIAPDLPFILVSGYAEAETADKIAAVPAIKQVLRKPVTAALLERSVRDVLAS